MSNIKIQDTYQRVQYTATASQTEFSVPFTFFSNSDLIVYKDSTLLTEGTAPTEYGVTGAGSPTGGLVTLVNGASSGEIITIIGHMPIDRTSIYSATISNLTGSALNGDFNREVVMMKQIETTQKILQLQYQPYAEVSQDDTVTRDRWLPRLDAGQVWRMNTGGTAIEAVDFDDVADAPADAYYWLGIADGGLPNGISLGALGNGLLKQSVSAGIATPAIAINGTDYWAPGDDLTRASAPVNPSDVVNKTYADALAAGFNILNPVRVASTANFTSTYDNGASGIGATLTATSNGAASIDGVSLALNDRVLFKDQTTTYENGIYYVSQVGDGSTPAIYTRATDFDQPSEIEVGDLILVRQGTANSETFWLQTATVTTIGTDAIVFDLFGISPTNVVTISETQTVTGSKTFNLFSGTLDANLNVDSFFIVSSSGNPVTLAPASGQNVNVTLGGAGKFNINATTGIDGIIDDDTFATASATTAATSESIKAYIDSLIAAGTDWKPDGSATITSNTPTIEWTDFSTDAIAYKFVLEYVHPFTDNVALQVRLYNGATFVSSASSYSYRLSYFTGSYNNNASVTATAIALSIGTGNVNPTEGVWGELLLMNPRRSATHTTLITNSVNIDTAGAIQHMLALGQRNAAEDNSGIQFLFSTGDINNAIIRRYVLRAS